MNYQTLKEFKIESNIDIIKAIIKFNDGYVTSKQLTDLGIHRMYLNIMQKKGMIERVRKGIYIDVNIIEDTFYTFQLKYPKTIFSGFTALYFHGLTELFPSTYDLTVNYNYHSDEVNNNNNVIRCKDEFIKLGLTNIETPSGHKVNAYDIERCICDIIRFRKKLDLEQVKKSVKMYINNKNKDLNKLREYAMKLNVYNEVMEFVGMFYE